MVKFMRRLFSTAYLLSFSLPSLSKFEFFNKVDLEEGRGFFMSFYCCFLSQTEKERERNRELSFQGERKRYIYIYIFQGCGCLRVWALQAMLKREEIYKRKRKRKARKV